MPYESSEARWQYITLAEAGEIVPLAVLESAVEHGLLVLHYKQGTETPLLLRSHVQDYARTMRTR